MNKIEIVFYLNAISDGGQCKVILDVAYGISNFGYSVTFLYSKITSDIFITEKIKKSSIKFIDLNVKLRLNAVYPLTNFLKTHQPDIIISGGSDNNCVVVLSKILAKSEAKVIISEHASLTSILKNTKKPYVKALPILMQALYPHADAVIAVSKGVSTDISRIIRLPIDRIKVIYNPVIHKELLDMSKEALSHPWFLDKKDPIIIAAGRLSYEKGYINLINAFHIISENTTCRLLILGEGPQRYELQNKIDSLNLSDKVQLYGRVNNPYAYMSSADLFVLSSLWEGFGNVLVEALACNTPVVSTDCPHGPREILEDGKWGKLVPIEDSEALAKAMLDTLNSPRQDVFKRAEEFTHDKSIARYVEVIENLT